jgi:excisionase family DNA binding protein
MERHSNLLTYDEAAKLLRLHPVTLRRLVSQRRIPFVKIGRSVRFVLEDLIQWIKDHRFPGDDE